MADARIKVSGWADMLSKAKTEGESLGKTMSRMKDQWGSIKSGTHSDFVVTPKTSTKDSSSTPSAPATPSPSPSPTSSPPTATESVAPSKPKRKRKSRRRRKAPKRSAHKKGRKSRRRSGRRSRRSAKLDPMAMKVFITSCDLCKSCKGKVLVAIDER